MDAEYTDKSGIKHDLIIFRDTHKSQDYYRIVQDGQFFCDLTRRVDGIWEELFEGQTQRSIEYGKYLETIIIYPKK